MHVEETSHAPQWILVLLASISKALVIVHTLREILGENKKLARVPFGNLLQLLCETS